MKPKNLSKELKIILTISELICKFVTNYIKPIEN
jgi:hypothetical protein